MKRHLLCFDDVRLIMSLLDSEADLMERNNKTRSNESFDEKRCEIAEKCRKLSSKLWHTANYGEEI